MAKTKPIFDADEDRRLDAKAGKILRDIRHEAGLSQKSLAISMGITNTYLCELEKGTRLLRMSLWNKAMEIINNHALGK